MRAASSTEMLPRRCPAMTADDTAWLASARAWFHATACWYGVSSVAGLAAAWPRWQPSVHVTANTSDRAMAAASSTLRTFILKRYLLEAQQRPQVRGRVVLA